MNKMDTRIRELESELDAENRRMADAQKNLRFALRSGFHLDDNKFTITGSPSARSKS